MSKEIKYFNSDEIQKILSDDLKTTKYKQYLLCMVLSYTGARITEVTGSATVTGLVVGDIKKVQGKDEIYYTIRLQTMKRKGGKKEFRTLILQEDLKKELLSYISAQNLKKNDKLFEVSGKTAYNWVNKACLVAGFDDDRCHPHAFRHSFAINSILLGVPVTVLKQWLGHADIKNTLIYTELLAFDSKSYWDKFKY